MKLYETWKKMAEMQQTPQQQVKYWNEYFAMETEIYKKILQNRDTKFQGKLEELAKEFDMDPVVFCGFMDGINTSLVNGYDVECLEETSDIVLDVDFEKLFYNMLEASPGPGGSQSRSSTTRRSEGTIHAHAAADSNTRSAAESQHNKDRRDTWQIRHM